MKRPIQFALVGLVAATLISVVMLSRLHSHPSLARYTSLQMIPSQPEADGLRARFMGVTTILLDDGETAIMTDGFFSRPGWRQSIAGKIRPDQRRIDSALGKAGVHCLAVLLVAHSHHDHAMDSAVVAKQTGALLVGSESTANIGRGAGFPEDDIRIIEVNQVYTFGRFKVTPYKSPHSVPALYRGEITTPLHPPVRLMAYQEGGSFSFLIEHDRRTILIHPSANFVPGMYKNVHADVVFLGIGTLGNQSEKFANDYWRELVQATGANLVVPVHWDDFMIPLDQPLQPMPAVLDDFDRSMEMIRRMAERDSVAVRLMPLFESVDVLAVAL